MVDIRIVGSADFSQVGSQLRSLQKQTALLNAELERTGIAAQGINPKGYQQMQAGLRASSQTFRSAAASTGQFYTEQLRLNSATDQFTKNLIKQKLSFAELFKQRKLAMDAYREQVRLQNMYVREAPSMSRGGKGLYDIVVPKQVSAELNTIGEKMRWINALVKSGSTQMINWGKNTQWAGRQLMVGFTVPTIAFGAATGALAFQVDKQMTRIKKVYDTSTVAVKGDAASMAAANMELAEVTKQAWQTAEDAANNYGSAMTDTLKVQADLAATGLKGADLQKSTAEVMRIATLGELDYNEATMATIALQSAFKLSTKELGDAFNFMNATENATSLSIQDIVEATPRAATAMSQLGVSVEQMTVMLTAMRESGVDAAEAANALKSATGTILAPSPAADEFIQQISNGTVQVKQLAQESGGNLYLALQNLYGQMEGLSDLQKQQILVKLFGKYQFNRVSALVRNLGDAFTGTSNQTKKAMDLMGQSTEQWANTADIELSKITESASGKFKIALENIKISLAEIGEPFLEAGTSILNVIGDIIKAFDSLPDSVKTWTARIAIVAALVGPLVMLVGLSANFLGTIIKFGNALAALGRTTGIVTKETKAMELASISAKNGWDQQTSAVMMLNEQLERLILSEQAAKGAAMPYMRAGSVPVSPMAAPSQQYRVNQMSQMWQGAMNSGPAIPNLGVAVREGEVLAKSTGKMKQYLAQGAASMGLLTAGMIATSASSNELVQSLGKMATFAGIGGMFSRWGIPIGLAVGGVMALSNHLKKVYDESVSSERALTNSTQLWANAADKVLRKFEAIKQASTIQIDPTGDPNAYNTALNRWQGKEMEGTLDEFKGLSDSRQTAFILDKFIDLQNRLGLSAGEAGVEIQAMMVASGKSFTAAEIKAKELLDTIGSIADDKSKLSFQLEARIDMIDTKNVDTISDTAAAAGGAFQEAFMNAATPEDAQALVKQITDKQQALFQSVVDKLEPDTKRQFKELGINSMEAFNDAVKNGDINWSAQNTSWGAESQQDVMMMMAKMQQFSQVVAQTTGEASGLGDEWSDFGNLMDTVLYKSKLNTEEQNKALAVGLATAGRIGIAFDKNAETQTLTDLNTIALNMHLAEGGTIAEALNNILNGVAPTIDDATGSAQQLGNALSTALSSGFRFSGADRKKMLQEGMSTLIGDMASQASENFSDRMDNDIEALQDSWDDRIENQQKADDRAQKHLENVWERRKKRLEEAYQSQIDGIQNVIDKEQKQEDLRQKMFEAEMTRLDRLAQMANTNIDFNVAVNSGDLDEAAKIQTNSMAQWQQWNIDDAMNASSDKADARSKKLEDRIAALEEERDAEMDDLDKREEQEKNHLDRVQELRMDALKDQEEAAMDARKRAWDLDKKSFDSRLDLFKAFTGRNMKDLRAWMDETGFAYEDFGDTRLKPMGQDWAQYFREKLKDNIRVAGAQIASDKMWEDMAGKEAAAVLRGFGFNNMQELARFIKTGKMPKNPPTNNDTTNSSGDDHRSPQSAPKGGGRPAARKAPSASGGATGTAGLMSGLAGAMFAKGMGSAIGKAFKDAKANQSILGAVHSSIGAAIGHFLSGPGGYHRPVLGGTPGGIHDTDTGYPATDLAVPSGTPLYAPNDGRILESYDIKGYEARRKVRGVTGPSVQDGYRSYGRVITMQLDSNGDEVLMAHLSQRYVNAGDIVPGGSLIGLTGNTGHVVSSVGDGSHLHFGSADGNELAYFKRGGRVKGTGPAMVHDGETVVNKGHSKKFEAGIQTFSELEAGTFDPFRPGAQLLIDRLDRITQHLQEPGMLGGGKNQHGGTHGGRNLKTGTYNVKFDTPPNLVQNDLSRLFGMADVLSLTELMANSPIVDWIGKQGWGITSKWGPKQDSAVAFNKSKFNMVGQGTQKMNNTLGQSLSGEYGKGGARQMYAAFAHLKDTATGQAFWQIAAHTIAHIWKNPGVNRKVQQEQYGALAGLTSRLGANGEAVFLGGDLNNSPKEPQWFKPLRDAGLVSNWNAATMAGQQGTHGSSFIDYVMGNAVTKLLSSKTVGGMSSDHNAAITEWQLPQLKSGGFTMSDGMAMLHEGEAVTTKPLTKQLIDGIGNFADGGNSEYNLHVYPSPGMDEEALARKTIRVIERREARKPRNRKG